VSEGAGIHPEVRGGEARRARGGEEGRATRRPDVICLITGTLYDSMSLRSFGCSLPAAARTR